VSGPYLRRVVDDELDELLPALPALSLEGAKGVGKTATARRRALTAHRLDDRGERDIVQAEPSRLTTGRRPILIDEWQRVPESWDIVRRAVDDGAPDGSFLLTGSPPAPGTTTHSGAGRIVVVRMRPLSLAERATERTAVSLAELLRGEKPQVRGNSDTSLADYVDEITRSGFPGFRGLTDRASRAQLDGYIERIVDREFPEMGYIVRNPAGLRRWLAAYAAASATSASFEAIRDAATGGSAEKPSRAAATPYRDVLERLHIVDPVPAWLPTRNRIARLGAAPKHHLVDPALAARLLRVEADALLSGRDAGPPIPRDGTLLGSLFESLVTQSLRVYAQAAEATVGHLRTHRGEREIDLIVEHADGRVLAVEVKLSAAVDDHDVRHLLWLQGQIGHELLDTMVVTTGREAYRRKDGIAVVPAALLGP
jgi:predicted AAA+ superfamily ATPase